MQQTSNYQLNQWEGTDRILRTDFNADNAKIDAAIAELREELAAAVAACPIVKLMDVTAEEDTAQIDLDLAAINLDLYSALVVEIHPSVSSTQSASLCIRCNNLTSIYHRNDGTSNGLTDFNLGANVQAALMQSYVALMAGGLVGVPFHSHWNKPTQYHYIDCLDQGCGTTAVNKSTLQSLNVVMLGTQKYLGSGTRVILRGIKL